MTQQLTFMESLKSLLLSGAGLAILLFLTLGFAATVVLATKKNARTFIAGMVPFVKPRDEKGNIVKRTPGQWVGMCVLIGVVLALIII